MTRNQVDALRNLEEKRHNLEQEKLAKWSIPAQYLSSIGSLARGVSGFFKPSGKAAPAASAGFHKFRSARGYSAPHLSPTTWTIE